MTVYAAKFPLLIDLLQFVLDRCSHEFNTYAKMSMARHKIPRVNGFLKRIYWQPNVNPHVTGAQLVYDSILQIHMYVRIRKYRPTPVLFSIIPNFVVT